MDSADSASEWRSGSVTSKWCKEVTSKSVPMITWSGAQRRRALGSPLSLPLGLLSKRGAGVAANYCNLRAMVVHSEGAALDYHARSWGDAF